MPQADPGTEMIQKVKGLLSSKVFSDLTLTCQGKSLKVHKVILYMQSEYFRKLLDGNFREAGAATINLPDDEPSVLQVLIHYLYNFNLDTSYRPPTAGTSTFLVQIYAIADKYDVPPLRRLAVQRLDKECMPVQNTEDFIAVLRATDACTAESTIWDILLPKVKANITYLLRSEDFRQLLMDLPALALPLVGLLDGNVWEKACAQNRKRLDAEDIVSDDDLHDIPPLSRKAKIKAWKKGYDREEGLGGLFG